MDIIDDVDSAFDAYIKNDFPESNGERYLRIYGIMQSLFLQQDALSDLIRAIHPNKAITRTDVLKNIREARNASIGHPTSMNRKGVLSTHGIVQQSMRKDGFELLSYPSEQGKVFDHVPVLALISKQRAETTRILSEVAEDLREQEKAHRDMFKDTKLVEKFSGVSYAFEKIFAEVHGSAHPALGGWAVGHLQQSLDDFAAALNQRSLEIDSYDSIKYLFEDISHPLTELKKFVSGEASEVSSRESARVFADALQAHFNRLRHIAREIDEEYSSEPTSVTRAAPSAETPINVIISVVGKAPELP